MYQYIHIYIYIYICVYICISLYILPRKSLLGFQKDERLWQSLILHILDSSLHWIWLGFFPAVQAELCFRMSLTSSRN